MIAFAERFAFRGLVLLGCLLASRAATAGDGFLRNGVTAHRGDSVSFPENTLPAFRAGIESGADWIELDIFRSSDGKLVVTHDRTTGRVGDRDLVVAESTYEALRTIDVAVDFRRRTGRTLEQCPVERMPLLEDVLRLVIAQGRTRASIQPKVDCVAEAIAVVRALKAERWVGFNDGNLTFMSEVKRLAPEIPVFWDRALSDLDDDLRIARERGFEALVLHHSTVTPEKVAAIRAAGFEPGAWTVNDPARMAELLDMGVERLYTDDPRRLLALKAEREALPVTCEGTYPQHLQGVCRDDRGDLFWSFTDRLVKTDAKGRVVKSVPVGDHHGDLCHVAGKIHVAVNFGAFNEPEGKADSWIYTYDAATLAELSRHPVPELVHGAGGIAFDGRRFLVVGGLPPGTEVNYAYEYDEQFRFVRRHVLASGYTRMGIQTAEFAEGRWWFGCYGDPKVLLVADASLGRVERSEFDASLGLIGLGGGRFLVASGPCAAGQGCSGALSPARVGPSGGLETAPR